MMTNTENSTRARPRSFSNTTTMKASAHMTMSGQQGGEARQPQRPHLPREHREHLAVGGQVGGDEEHDENLRQLAGLEAEAADAQPQLAAAGLIADDRQHGREQKQDAHDHERVFIVGELVQVAHDGEGGNHGRDADEQPQQLVHGQIGHNAGHERDTDARQRERNGQNSWVGRQARAGARQCEPRGMRRRCRAARPGC